MAKVKVADLAEFDSLTKAQEEGIDVEIKGPDGKAPLGFSIKVAGPDSERAQAASDAIQQSLIEREDLDDLSAEERRANGLRYLAKLVISWTPFILDGGELECSEENAVKLFSRFPFIRLQVDHKAGRRANFLQG
jgi:hypothetical protein